MTGTVIDSLYYEVGVQAEAAEKGATQFEGAGERIETAAQTAEDAVTGLVEEMLKTPEGARQVQQVMAQLAPVMDDVSAGMTQAASGSARFDQGLRVLAQQQAETAIRTAELARPIDAVAARMGFATSGAAKWEEGLRRLKVQEAETAAQSTAVATASDGAAKGAGKVQNALVGLALQGTQTSGTVGKLIEGLLLVGVGSALVTGIAAGVAVIALAYQKITEEARKTKEAADAAHAAIVQSLQTPAGDLLKQIDDVTKEIDRLNALATVQVVAPSGKTTQNRGLTAEEKNDLARLTADRETFKQQLEQTRAQQRDAFNATLNDLTAARDQLLQAISARQGLGLPVEDLRNQLSDLEKILAGVQATPVDQQGKVAEALKTQVTARRAMLAQARADLAQTFVDVPPTTIDATEQALVSLARRLTDLGAPAEEVKAKIQPLVEQLLRLKESAFTTQLAQASSFGPQQALDALDTLRQRTVDQLPPDSDTGAQAVAIRERLRQIDEARERINLRLVAENKAQGEALNVVEDHTSEIADNSAAVLASTRLTTAQLIEAARGGLGLLQAFGGMQDATAAVLQNVLTIASTLPSAIQQIQGLGKLDDLGNPKSTLAGTITSFTGVLGGIAGVLSGLGGIFGES